MHTYYSGLILVYDLSLSLYIYIYIRICIYIYIYTCKTTSQAKLPMENRFSS